jgi:Raf kinase inhibitor-like YbhB/YbcL family protein
MKLTSPAFGNDGEIPVQFTGEGQDLSPPLEWSEVPRGGREFVLFCEDPDAPQREGGDSPFIHWVIYNLSPSVTALPEGLVSQGRIEAPIRADQGINSFKEIGYKGPMPPLGHGIHHYVFKLFAINTELALPPGATKEAVLNAMQGHILDAAQLIGKYKRESVEQIA